MKRAARGAPSRKRLVGMRVAARAVKHTAVWAVLVAVVQSQYLLPVRGMRRELMTRLFALHLDGSRPRLH